MKRFVLLWFSLVLPGFNITMAQGWESPRIRQVDRSIQPAAKSETTVLREMYGIKLNMTREEVRRGLRKPNQSTAQMDEFKVEGDDILTVHYGSKGLVKTIQLYCTEAKRAPAWKSVIGDAQIEERENGSKFARKVVDTEDFWVTMYQSKSGDVTTVTMSRQDS